MGEQSVAQVVDRWLRPISRPIVVKFGLTAQVAQYAEILKEEVPTVVKILTKQMETPENLLVDGRPMEASLRFQPRPRVFRDAHALVLDLAARKPQVLQRIWAFMARSSPTEYGRPSVPTACALTQLSLKALVPVVPVMAASRIEARCRSLPLCVAGVC